MALANIKQFEQTYAKRSGVTVQWLHEQGMHGATCACGEPTCEGFKMVQEETAEARAKRETLTRLRRSQ